jgi:predicted DNA-binding protein (MmcQ/YjbR family)
VTPGRFHEAALALTGATYDVKWGADRCYSVGGKMFAVAGHVDEARPRWCLKVTDGSYEQLIDEGVADSAPYVGRYKWVLFKAHDAVPDDQLLAYLSTAHALVAAKLPAKQRKALGLGALEQA